MLRIAFFLGIGCLLGGIVAAIVGPPGAGGWQIPVGLTLAIVAGTLVLIARAFRGVPVVPAEVVAAARAANRLGVARVDVLSETGTRVNEQPLCELTLTVQPGPDAGAAPFRVRIRQVIPVSQIAGYAPGTRHVAALLSASGPELVLLDDPVAAVAWAGVEIPEADAAGAVLTPQGGVLRADGSRRRPLIGTGRRGRPARVVVYILAAAVAAGAVLWPLRPALALSASALADGRLHADLREPAYLPESIATLTAAIGHENAFDVVVTEDFMTVQAPVVPDSGTASDEWQLRRGVVEHRGPALIQPRAAAEQFPLDEVSWDAFGPALVEGAKLAEAAGITGITSEVLGEAHFTVQRSTDSDVHSDSFGQSVGPVTVRFSLHGPYDAAFFEMAPDGSGLRITQ